MITRVLLLILSLASCGGSPSAIQVNSLPSLGPESSMESANAPSSVASIVCSVSLPRAVDVSAKDNALGVRVASCNVTPGAIALSLNLTSTLSHARGLVRLDFINAEGGVVGSWLGPPFVGKFAGLEYRPVVEIPAFVSRVNLIVHTEGTVSSGGESLAEGEFKVAVEGVSQGLALDIVAAPTAVTVFGQSSEWHIKSARGAPNVVARVNVRDIDGLLVRSTDVSIPPGMEVPVVFPGLQVGYYRVSLDAAAPGYLPLSLSRSLAVLAARPPNREARFGLDAALSWYGGSRADIARALELMKMAGVGAVRDRLSWSSVQPDSNQLNWGRYLDVAKQVAADGFEQVTTFHDSPLWVRPGDSVKRGNFRPPTDMEATRRFGAMFARDMGPYVGAIEFWNEPNSEFFAGTPWAYSNAYKAFSSGVKSENPEVVSLVGSSARDPGEFFGSVYANGTGQYLDVLNQHYHGDLALFPTLVERSISPREAVAGFSAIPRWITEMGFSLRRDEHGSLSSSERAQASHLVKAYAEGFGNGYERVFYFFLRELIEGNTHTWGILEQDFSPRPAYVALAALTRHLSALQPAATRRVGAATAVFFRETNGGYSAVVWGKGDLAKTVGPFRTATDIFGRRIGVPPSSLSDEPYLLAGIQNLPNDAVPIAPRHSKSGALPLVRLEVSAFADEPKSTEGHRTTLAVAESTTVALEGVVKANKDGVSRVAPIAISCSGSSGVELIEVAPKTVFLGQTGEAHFRCTFKAKLASIGRGYLRAEAKGLGVIASGQIELIAEIGVGAMASHNSVFTAGECPVWLVKNSKNLDVALSTMTNPVSSNCPAAVVTAEVKSAGDSWVFPSFAVPGNRLSGLGIVVNVAQNPGVPFPPRDLLLQIAELSGAIWTVELKRQPLNGGGVQYAGLFSLAKLAPWSRVVSDRLNLQMVRDIAFGWGGYGGTAGQKFSYVVRSLSVFGGEQCNKKRKENK